MIVFDLECSKGHLFEGWFDSLDSFEDQKSRGLVVCPYCNETEVRKVLSPVAVKRPRFEPEVRNEGIDYQRLAKAIVDYVQEHFEDVGPGFATEALKMQYGVTDKRNIRGSTTAEEEKILQDEGVEFFKMPLPKIEDDTKN
jgi:hypothetical protein